MDEEEQYELGRTLQHIADAVTAPGIPGRDEAGGTVASLTEAVMGMTAGLCRIAEALEHIATAIEENTNSETSK